MGGGDSGQDQDPTADQIVQQQVNAKLWNYFKTDYEPMVQKYIGRSTDPAIVKEESSQVAGLSNAETMKALDPTKLSSNVVENMKTGNRISDIGTTSQIKGQGLSRSRQISNLQNVVNIGRGQATTAQAGFGDIAAQSVQEAIASKEIQQQEQSAIENAYASAAGAGIGAAVSLNKSGRKVAGPAAPYYS